MYNSFPSNFKVAEFLRSETADKFNIRNYPDSWAILENLRVLALHLDYIRKVYGGPVTVTSGYRCNELNKKVAGVFSSLHRQGLAADIKAAKFEKLKKAVMETVRISPADMRKMRSGNLIYESSNFEIIFYPTFIHFGIKPEVVEDWDCA